MKKILTIIGLAAVSLAGAQAAEQFWKTNGTSATWTGSTWGASGAGPFATAWTSGNDARFTDNSTVTFATTTVGNVTVDAGKTVTIAPGGTLSFTGSTVKIWDIGAGSTLTWQSQTVTANSAAGMTKTGAGILDLGALTWGTNMSGGFTLNNGTVIVSGNKALGNGSLTLNGGTLQSSGTRAFTPTSIVIGGNFALAGTGNSNWDLATTIDLGSTTRTITNNTTSGSRQFRGLISGSAGSGLIFAGSGGAQIYIGNTGNTFTGPVEISGGEVVFNDNGSFGSTTSITIDGGRLTMASLIADGTPSAISAATIATTRNIFVGSTAGTSISVQGSTGVTSYTGVIADKTSSIGILVKQGAGTLALGGVSTYTGNTAINNGIVQLTTGNDRLPTGTVVSLGQSASANLGTLDLNGSSQQIAGLQSAAGTNAGVSTNLVTSATAATLTIANSGDFTYSAGTAANSGVISGAIRVVKSGAGTQTLGGVNTYSGDTTINGGTLLLSGGGTIGTGNLALGGGTFDISSVTGSSYSLSSSQSLTGSGNIFTGGKTLNVAGTLAPGNSPGTVTVTGNLAMTPTTISNFEIAGITSGLYDFLEVSGTLTFNGVLNLTTSYAFTLGDFVQIFDASVFSGAFAGITGTDLGGGYFWDTSALNSTGIITVSTSAIPEPQTPVLMGLGLAFVMWRFRRKARLS